MVKSQSRGRVEESQSYYKIYIDTVSPVDDFAKKLLAEKDEMLEVFYYMKKKSLKYLATLRKIKVWI